MTDPADETRPDWEALATATERQRALHPFDPAPEHEFCAYCAGPEEIAAHQPRPSTCNCGTTDAVHYGGCAYLAATSPLLRPAPHPQSAETAREVPAATVEPHGIDGAPTPPVAPSPQPAPHPQGGTEALRAGLAAAEKVIRQVRALDAGEPAWPSQALAEYDALLAAAPAPTDSAAVGWCARCGAWDEHRDDCGLCFRCGDRAVPALTEAGDK